MPKIGLYILNYNYRDFLPWALRSVQALTQKPDVLIFMDDHSSDDSIKIVNDHFGNMHFEEMIVNEQNKGSVASMNLAVSKLGEDYSCDYIFGLAADDVLHPQYLEKTAKTLEEAPIDVGYIYTWVRRIGDENSIDAHPEWDYDLLMKTPYIHGSALIKYEAWKSVGGLPEVPREEDWECYKSMAKIGWKGKLIPEPLLMWRKHRNFARTYYGEKGGQLRGEAWQKKG